VAVVLGAAGVAGFYNTTHQAFWYGLNIVALLAFAAFVLAVSVEGLIAPASRPRSVLAPPREAVPST
jgi:hypothetical protein